MHLTPVTAVLSCHGANTTIINIVTVKRLPSYANVVLSAVLYLSRGRKSNNTTDSVNTISKSVNELQKNELIVFPQLLVPE